MPRWALYSAPVAAARIASAATGGQALASNVVRELAAGKRERACPEWDVGPGEDTKGHPPRLRRPRPPLRSPLAPRRNRRNLSLP